MNPTHVAARDVIRLPLVRRALPGRPGRSRADLELAARMLEKLRSGQDIRADKVAAARRERYFDHLDDPAKLDLALDRLIDHLEGDGV